MGCAACLRYCHPTTVHVLNQVTIPFHYCLSGTMERSNPTCKLSPIWYVPGSIQLDKQALLHIKRKAAREMLSHQLVTSLKPFAVMAVLGRPTIPSPPKPIYVKKFVSLVDALQEEEI